jgi:hypothetical protein
MPTIFINYRRDDSAGYAGRIHERLTSTFGSRSVFMDLDDIQPGANFVKAIEEHVAACDCMLVLIGKRWLDSRDPAGARRLDNPGDFVRIEIARALERKIRVVPVLLGTTSMPTERDLPPDIRSLAKLQAITLSDKRWDYDINELVRALGGKPRETTTRTASRVAILASTAIMLLVGLVVWILWQPRPVPPPPPNASGRWVADVQYDFGGSHSEEFVFQVNGNTVMGTASFLGVDRGILEGRVDGNRIEFVTRSEELLGSEVRETRHQYVGTFDENGLQLMMQTQGSASAHPPVRVAAKREEIPATGGPRPWSQAGAALTLTDGRVVSVRAETLSNCISVTHALDLASGQSIEFQNMKSIEVLRADPLEAPSARADLRIILVNGQTIEDSMGAACDVFGYNDAGRFSTYLQNLKSIEFLR